MKRLLFLIAALCACALPVCAQNSNLGPAIGSGLPPVPSYYTGAIQFPGAPSGACAAPMLAENAATGHLFDCLNGSWNDIGSTGGGGNALTSNPLSQFAATTSAQLAGVLSDETGSGLVVFGTSPTLTGAALGSSTATTQSAGDNTTKLATTAFVSNIISTGCMTGCSYGVGTGGDTPTPYGGSTSTMSTNNVGQYIKFWNNNLRTLGNATLRVTAIGAGGHFSAGVYSISGTTGTLIWTTGSQSTASAVNIPVTPTPISLLPNTSYYIAWCADNTTTTLAGVSNSAISENLGSSSAAHTYGINSTDVCTAGVLPSTITTTNITNSIATTQVGIYATN